MKYLVCLFVVLSFNVEATICDQTSILREPDGLFTCGQGIAESKIEAEMEAYKNAIDVVELHCKVSIECKDKKYSVTPMRVICNKNGQQYTCNRLLQVDLISVLEVETKTDLLFQFEVSLISDSRYRSADYDLGLMLNNRFNRYSVLLYVGYKYSNINVKYYDILLDTENYEGVSYTGLSLGTGIGYSKDRYEFQLLLLSSNQKSSKIDSAKFKESEAIKKQFQTSQVKLNFLKTISNSGKIGMSVSELNNTLGVRANTIGFVYQYEF